MAERSTAVSASPVKSSPTAVCLQRKLTVNTPGDKYEQEADRVAEQVLRMPEPKVQCQCDCGKHSAEGECSECKRKKRPAAGSLQRAANSSVGGMTAPPIVNDALNYPGTSLPATARSFMESRFGRDFSHVRVHTDRKAAESAAAVQARAYTVRNHIVFGPGEHPVQNYKLLAHELTHVIQQTGGCTAVQRSSLSESPIAPELPKGHTDLKADPEDWKDYLQRLKTFVEQSAAHDKARGGVPDPGHLEKLEGSLRQVKNLERDGKISKKMVRAARNVIHKSGGPRVAEMLTKMRLRSAVKKGLLRVAASKAARRTASLIPLLGWAMSSKDAWDGVKDVVAGHVGRGLSGVGCAAADVASDFLHLGDAVTGVGGTALSLGLQAGTITCQTAIETARSQEKMNGILAQIESTGALPSEDELRAADLDDEAIEELKESVEPGEDAPTTES